MCRSFPSSQGMAREAPVGYQRQLSEPGLQYPPQGFKQEYHDPRYEQASRAGSSCQYPAAVVVKQEQVDYVYDSGINRVLSYGGVENWETGCGVGNAINLDCSACPREARDVHSPCNICR